MADMVLKCRQCGSVDDTHTFQSADQAAVQLRHWACPRCAWTEYELVPAAEKDAIELGPGQR